MNPTEPEWRGHYLAALRESDPLELWTLISTADTAMHFRVQELGEALNGQQERQEIDDARCSLQDLKGKILNSPPE